MRIEIEKTVTSSILKCDKCGILQQERYDASNARQYIVSIPEFNTVAYDHLRVQFHVCMACVLLWIVDKEPKRAG